MTQSNFKLDPIPIYCGNFIKVHNIFVNFFGNRSPSDFHIRLYRNGKIIRPKAEKTVQMGDILRFCSTDGKIEKICKVVSLQDL